MGSASLAALLLVGLTACASGPLGEGGVLKGQQLPRGVAVLVMSVADIPAEVDGFVENSGVAIVRATRRQLSAAGFEALADGATTLAEAYQAARDLDCALVARGEILEWADPGSKWVHGGDKLAVMLTLWSVDDEVQLAWGADELEDRSMHSGLEPTHRLADALLKSIVEGMLRPGATVPRLEEL